MFIKENKYVKQLYIKENRLNEREENSAECQQKRSQIEIE